MLYTMFCVHYKSTELPGMCVCVVCGTWKVVFMPLCLWSYVSTGVHTHMCTSTEIKRTLNHKHDPGHVAMLAPQVVRAW